MSKLSFSRMGTFYALLIILALTFTSRKSEANNSTTVAIPATQQQFTFSKPLPLEAFLSALHQSKSFAKLHTFPFSYQLFDTNRELEAVEFQTTVLEKLQFLAQSNHTLKTSAELLLQQVKRWDVGYRIFTPLDWDVVRIDSGSNLTLSGNYELLTPLRKERVIFEGLLVSPQSIALKSTNSLSAYTSQIRSLSSANPSYAWVIYPDGTTRKVGYALWNETPVNLTPNSVVFFGFNSEEPSLVQLEKDIVKLITMRKAL
ncbi:capsule biosynthesis GfcC family protein [Vibrio panuliri]|nr:capsule biosynthesis GfcC family protein [Vibrio panuliri]